MSAQLSYSYQTPRGVPGGIMDISPYRIDSRANGETAPGILKFGMGAMQGDTPGVNVLRPLAGDTADAFEGIVMTGFTQQQTMLGELELMPQQVVGIMRWGTAWVRVASGAAPQYGDPLNLVISGPDAGKFTTSAAGTLAIKGRFIGGLGTGPVAPVELFNQLAE